MKKVQLLSIILVGFAMLLPVNPLGAGAGEAIRWIGMQQAIELSEKKNNQKKFFIDVYTDWCGWCKKMDAATFSDPMIGAFVNRYFYAVKFDAEGKESIKLKGQEFKFVAQGSRGYHELAAALLNGKMSYPTTVYMDEQFQMLSPVPGYLDKPTFSKIISYYGENHHKKTPWPDYEKSFTGLK